MGVSILSEEWSTVRGLLPAGWEELARSCGALLRARQVKDPETLLRLILLHAGGGLSLRQAVVRARVAGLASISDVALLKRLRASEQWLSAITSRMLAARRRPMLSLTSLGPGHRLRVVDATTIQEPGSTGTSWRLHYSMTLPSLTCDHFKLTGPEGGETYKNFAVRAGDVILADRGYCHREGVAHAVARGGHVVVRMNTTSLPLLDSRGREFGLMAHLRTIRDRKAHEWPVVVEASTGRIPARLCAVRKNAIAAASARKKLRSYRSAKCRKKKLQRATLEAAGYVFVLTTIPRNELTAARTLDLYRARWQVELAFKRLKSLLEVGHVPKHDPRSARSWIQAKMLTVLLIERLIDRARFFSPWGFELEQV